MLCVFTESTPYFYNDKTPQDEKKKQNNNTNISSKQENDVEKEKSASEKAQIIIKEFYNNQSDSSNLISNIINAYINDEKEDYKAIKDYYKKQKEMTKDSNTSEIAEIIQTNKENNQINKMIKEKTRETQKVQEENLYFCSEEEILKKAKNFYNNCINRYNDKITIVDFHRELEKFEYHLSRCGKNNYFDRNKTIKAIDYYVDKLNYDFDLYIYLEDVKLFYGVINRNEYRKSIIEKISKKLVNSNILKMSEEIEKNNYDVDILENLFRYLLNNNLSIEFKKLKEELDKLKELEYFIPNLNNSISKDINRFLYRISSCINKYGDNAKVKYIKKDIELILLHRLPSSTILGKNRMKEFAKSLNIDL